MNINENSQQCDCCREIWEDAFFCPACSDWRERDGVVSFRSVCGNCCSCHNPMQQPKPKQSNHYEPTN
jgi:hypothetical protein